MSLELGRRIRGLRRLKRLTQKELADHVNISVSLLSNIERGFRKPQPVLLENIAVALGVLGEELFIFSSNNPGLDEVDLEDRRSETG